jgi:hypothetical protein
MVPGDPAEELKSETSRTPVPIPRSMALELSPHVQETQAQDSLLGASPWAVERAKVTRRSCGLTAD